jgi:hypothetical protein
MGHPLLEFPIEFETRTVRWLSRLASQALREAGVAAEPTCLR